MCVRACVFVHVCPSDWHSEAGGLPRRSWDDWHFPWHESPTHTLKTAKHTYTYMFSRTENSLWHLGWHFSRALAPLALVYLRKCLSGARAVQVIWRKSLGCCGDRLLFWHEESLALAQLSGVTIGQYGRCWAWGVGFTISSANRLKSSQGYGCVVKGLIGRWDNNAEHRSNVYLKVLLNICIFICFRLIFSFGLWIVMIYRWVGCKWSHFLNAFQGGERLIFAETHSSAAVYSLCQLVGFVDNLQDSFTT